MADGRSIRKNKGGRPKGSKNSVTLIKEAMAADGIKIIKENFKEIIRAMVTEARDGNVAAAALLINKIIPNENGDLKVGKGDMSVNIVIGDMQEKVKVIEVIDEV